MIKRLVTSTAALALAGAIFVPATSSAGPPGQDPLVPNMTAAHCPGGEGGFLAVKWCDGQKYPDGSYWHQLSMTGGTFATPIFRMDCVIGDGGPNPPLAPPGSCGGGA